MVIVSPEFALFMAVCIESPGSTIISAADPTPEINTKIRKISDKITSLFLISNPSVYSRKLGMKPISRAKIVLLVIPENNTHI
ncbi:MAG TPA: hypothetical protein HA261_09205 [Methanosarcina sp.]|nr:hypothetical protein [Methanosarcina sp.]